MSVTVRYVKTLESYQSKEATVFVLSTQHSPLSTLLCQSQTVSGHLA
ncbi:hypothetical protein LAY57_25410 [Argonema antarcticum A004/B2]|nr:hypothetical protein [Argonema antarcticum A004/B2]